MEGQDGISVRPMRLKVLYTFDDKTNCLARWPQVLDIQTAFLDEETQIGVIELKTCIQAIVSASPELVAKLGRDYTVYAYDYSEYETPLVGQGMLSWVLASASPTPDAPAHQSKTIVTGRVCKNALGLFSRGAQETLEVKLRLVPVPTALQSEYLGSMQKYRELSNVIPHDFDAQAWTSFLQANPDLLATNNSNSQQAPDQEAPSQVDRSGIEKLQQLLSEGATPRDFSNTPAENFHADSPGSYMTRAPSRASTPGNSRPAGQQQQQQKRSSEEAFRPSSRGSVQSFHLDARRQPDLGTGRRDSIISGYGSADEMADGPMPKRAKLVRPSSAEKPNTNIERQPGSLRVAASTAASVRIHRPTPLNPAIPSQPSGEDPVRPPTPIPSGPPALNRRNCASQSRLRRESTGHSRFSQLSDNMVPDENQITATSPEDLRGGGNVIDTPFNMPSSPPVMESMYPQTSSPVLPPMPDHDSGFMSGTLDSMLDHGNCNLEEKSNAATMQKNTAPHGHAVPRPEEPRSSAPAPSNSRGRNQHPMSDNFVDCSTREAAPSLPPQPRTLPGSRPSSSASFRRPSKRLTPAPVSQREVEEHARAAVPASEPIQPTHSEPPSQSVANPASELAPPSHAPTQPDYGKIRIGARAGSKRAKQVQARLEQCIKEGTVPPYCENCGAIETTTWRRAWSKVIEGNADVANSYLSDPLMLYWEPVETDSYGAVTAFKQFKKSLADDDKDYVMILLCNACGLWLHKCKSMRPENKWNKPDPKDKRKGKRKSTRARIPNAPGAATRSRTKSLGDRCSESSPGPTDASSPAVDDEETPGAETEGEKGNSNPKPGETQATDSGARRANSAEPPGSTEKEQWTGGDAAEALRRAIQSSPARNLETRRNQLSETQLTPKPVRRTLFPPSKDEGALRTLGDAFINGMRRTPRSSPNKKNDACSEKENNNSSGTNDRLDELFGTDEGVNPDMDFPASPTPKRRSPRLQSNKSKANNDDHPTSPSPTSGKERASQGAAGASPLASRTNNNILKTPKAATSSDQISPNSRQILDMFNGGEDEFGLLNSSNFFSPSKLPTDNWADWMPSSYFSPTGSASGSGHKRPNTGASGHSAEQSSGKDFTTSPAFLQSDADRESFQGMLNGDTGCGEGPGVPDSEIFDPTLVDPQLLELWSKGGPGGGALGNDGVGGIDEAVFSAIMDEVNGKTND